MEGNARLTATTALVLWAVARAISRMVSFLLWLSDRPYQAHVISHPWSTSRDASFPRDHVSASFAIAIAVLLVDRMRARSSRWQRRSSPGPCPDRSHHPGAVGAGAGAVVDLFTGLGMP
jgi:hypothetical protein